MRIFIVEDQSIVAEDLAERLTRNNFEVVGIASSGHQAIEEIKSVCPDLILMDVRINGELNGIEVAIIVQSFFRESIPIIFLTGFSEDAFTYLKVLDEYLYINKPVEESVLLKAIDRAIKKKQVVPFAIQEGQDLSSGTEG